MADTRTCPVNGCTCTIKVGKLMCPAHWRRVPAELQHDVYVAWRAYKGLRHQPPEIPLDDAQAEG